MRLFADCSWLESGRVSIHAPTRGATASTILVSLRVYVSIHAPTRGATVLTFSKSCLWIVSIHAPTRGATEYRGKERKEERFQSTHPRGVRHIDSCSYLVRLVVSIHAPTRGATYLIVNFCIAFVFQSTHPRGVRLYFWHKDTILFCFNPRTHEGCDCALPTPSWAVSGFNPRTHEGCDEACARGSGQLRPFQSTHPRGVRPILHPGVRSF